MLDLDTFLVTLYTVVDDMYQEKLRSMLPKRPGPEPGMRDSELLTLMLLAQWRQDSSERGFFRWAQLRLRPYFPNLPSRSRFNRRARALWQVLGMVYHTLVQSMPTDGLYRILDATPVPVSKIPRWRSSPFRGDAAKSWCAAKQEWYFGYKLFLAVTPEGIITSAALTPANVGDRPGAESILRQEQHPLYLADKGFCSPEWERFWRECYGVQVLAAPYRNHRRAWPEHIYREMSSKRQMVEVVVSQLKGLFALERHRTKTLPGLWARIAAKLAAFTLGQWLNLRYHRPLLSLATLVSL
jgi:IS5 family transposase